MWPTKEHPLCKVFILCVIAVCFGHCDEIDEVDQSAGKGVEVKDGLTVIDPNGYLVFCLCMGRFGNQLEHFLGGLAFAKKINRTLLVPPFRTYKNVPFNDWFKLEALAEYHRVMPVEDFMVELAPTVWPPEERIGFCFKAPSAPKDEDCNMKKGNPFGPFWEGLGVDFVGSETSVSYQRPDLWFDRFPPSKYPVIAMKGAPAPFPMKPEHWELQHYLVFSDAIAEEGQKYIQDNFPGEKYVGIHLRNGVDWDRACDHVEGRDSYMASPQCLHGTGKKLTKNVCLPSAEEILRLLKTVVVETGATVVFVATDKNPMIKEITNHLAAKKVKVFHADPWLPIIDIYILTQSDHFIGNCVSSFTSFVTRARAVHRKPTSFWGLD